MIEKHPTAPVALGARSSATATSSSGGVSDGDKGDITVSGSGATWSIDAGTVTLAKMANIATASLIYRKTAGTGDPEVQTLATLKTDLGLTGTNSGDQFTAMTAARLLGAVSAGPAVEIPLAGSLSFVAGALSAPDHAADFADIDAQLVALDADITNLGNTTQPLDTQLTDIAALVYTANAGKVIKVNAGATAFELATDETGGGGVSDGDKGDIVVSASGATWTVDTNVVDLTKLAQVGTGRLLYRRTAGTGNLESTALADLKTDLLLTGTNSGDQTSIVGITGTIAQFNTAITDGDMATGGGTATGTNTGDQTITLTGNVTGTGTGSFAATIANGAVTLAKMADVATATFLGRSTAATGVPEAMTVASAKTLLALTGTNSGDQTITLTGNVTGSGTGSFATTIPAGTVTLAMQANMATGSLVYRKTAAAGAPEVQTLATLKTDLLLTGTNSGDQTITLTGPVTGTGTGSFATTIATGVVTLANMANIATASILGRVTAAAGVPEVLTGTQTTTLLDVFTTALKGLAPASGGGTANFLRADGTWIAPPSGGTPPTGTGFRHITAGAEDAASKLVDTADINDAQVTLAKMANMATASLIYRKTAAAGVPEVQTLATLKTDLGLTGTNSGDQTITLTGDVTGTGTGSFATAIGANKVTDAMLRQSAGLSVVGRAGNTTGNIADITAGAADLVLRVNAAGTLIAFGQIGTGAITTGAVTLGKQADLAANSIIGNNTGSAATPIALTQTQTTAMLNEFTSALKGLAPASGGGTTNFLRADGTWAAAGGGSAPVRTVYTLTAAHSNSTTTTTTITDGTTPWSHSVVAGKNYQFTMIATNQAAATTTGFRLSVLPSGGAVGTYNGRFHGQVASAVSNNEFVAALYAPATSTTVWPAGSSILTTAVNPINVPHSMGLEFIYVCTTSGTLTIQYASEVAAASQVNIGSTLIVKELN